MSRCTLGSLAQKRGFFERYIDFWKSVGPLLPLSKKGWKLFKKCRSPCRSAWADDSSLFVPSTAEPASCIRVKYKAKEGNKENEVEEVFRSSSFSRSVFHCATNHFENVMSTVLMYFNQSEPRGSDNAKENGFCYQFDCHCWILIFISHKQKQRTNTRRQSKQKSNIPLDL